jgi:hypothetical protein
VYLSVEGCVVPRFRLYLKERELATNITSICLHSDFLLATTLDHRLDLKVVFW